MVIEWAVFGGTGLSLLNKMAALALVIRRVMTKQLEMDERMGTNQGGNRYLKRKRSGRTEVSIL